MFVPRNILRRTQTLARSYLVVFCNAAHAAGEDVILLTPEKATAVKVGSETTQPPP